MTHPVSLCSTPLPASLQGGAGGWLIRENPCNPWTSFFCLQPWAAVYIDRVNKLD